MGKPTQIEEPKNNNFRCPNSSLGSAVFSDKYGAKPCRISFYRRRETH